MMAHTTSDRDARHKFDHGLFTIVWPHRPSSHRRSSINAIGTFPLIISPPSSFFGRTSLSLYPPSHPLTPSPMLSASGCEASLNASERGPFGGPSGHDGVGCTPLFLLKRKGGLETSACFSFLLLLLSTPCGQADGILIHFLFSTSHPLQLNNPTIRSSARNRSNQLPPRRLHLRIPLLHLPFCSRGSTIAIYSPDSTPTRPNKSFFPRFGTTPTYPPPILPSSIMEISVRSKIALEIASHVTTLLSLPTFSSVPTYLPLKLAGLNSVATAQLYFWLQERYEYDEDVSRLFEENVSAEVIASHITGLSLHVPLRFIL